MTIINMSGNKFFHLLTEFRNKDTSSERLKLVYQYLGEIMGNKLIDLLPAIPIEITTPLNETYTGVTLNVDKTLILSTFEDNELFAKKIGKSLPNVCYGHLGTLSPDKSWLSNQEYLVLPDFDGELKEVETLIFCKSVLATGCTAKTYIDYIINKFNPSNIFILSLISSNEALKELTTLYKSYNLTFIIGETDKLNENNYLSPGVGNVESRLKEA